MARGELIGRLATVVDSTDPSLVGRSGRVVDETLNTLVLATNGGGRVIVSKAPCVFDFETATGRVRIEGNRIRYRPEDRTKKVK